MCAKKQIDAESLGIVTRVIFLYGAHVDKNCFMC